MTYFLGNRQSLGDGISLSSELFFDKLDVNIIKGKEEHAKNYCYTDLG